MNFEEYMRAVENGDYPEAIAVPLDRPFENAAGVIQNLVLALMRTATFIRSVAGAVRSNHYHKTDWHFMFVIEGQMDYYCKPAGSSLPPRLQIFRPGDLMFTPPLVLHATYFSVATSIMTFSRNPRDHGSHESDLVRQKLIEVKDGKVIVCG